MNIQQSLQKKLCELHNDRDDRIVKFLCLDNDCYQNPLGCVLCIKNNHQNCDSKYLFALDVFDKQIEFAKDDSNLKQKFAESIKRLVYNMNTNAKRKVQNRVTEIFTFLQKQQKISQQKTFNENDIKWIKDQQDIYLDNQEDQIIAKCFCSVDRENLKYSLQNFRRIQLANMNQYKNNLRKEQFFINENIQILQHLKCSEKLQYQLVGQNIEVKFKKQDDKKETYYQLLLLDKFYEKLKVTVYNDSEFNQKIEGYCGFAQYDKIQTFFYDQQPEMNQQNKMNVDLVSESKGFKYFFGMGKFCNTVGNKNNIQIPQQQILKMQYLDKSFMKFEFKNGKNEDNVCELSDDNGQYVFFLAFKDKLCKYKLKFKFQLVLLLEFIYILFLHIIIKRNIQLKII